jgi:hypothetical protein
MKFFFLILILASFTACMKSKDEYQKAISDVRQEQEAESEREIHRHIQREEANERNDQRSRGSNDAEGMGMDE